MAIPVDPASQIDTARPERSVSPEEVVDVLYRAVLRRPADASGRAAYANLLREGRSQLDLVRMLANSPEFGAKSLRSAGELSAHGTEGYDLDSDPIVAKYRTDDVRRLTDRLRELSVDHDQFLATAAEGLKELANTGEFYRSQEQYLRYHQDRFYEIACVTANLLTQVPTNPTLLDFGYSVNSLLLRDMFSGARIAVADRPEILAPAAKFAAVHVVNLLSDALHEVEFGSTFDVIVFSEVIEHLQINPVKVIRFLLKHLAADGYVLLTTPNLFSRSKLQNIAQRISPLAAYPLEYSQADSPHFHFREYGLGELLSMIDAAGGQVSAFFFSACWDDPALRDVVPPHELGNLFIVFQRREARNLP